MLRLRTLTCLLSAGAAFAVAPFAHAASWQTGISYGATGSSPTRTDIYVPDNVKSKPAVLFSIHYCSGQGSNAHSWFQSYADQYGFIIFAPTAHGNCFDANLHRSGEQADFVAMIDYAIMKYGADTDRVYAAGLSSGACMAQALIADYPDRFAGGSSFAGVPAGAWTGGNDYAWSTSGISGGAAWGDKVRAADPGFTGPRPHVQIWHGQGDTTLTFSQTYDNEVAQWTNVFGLMTSDGMEQMIKPSGAKSTWDRTSYKDCNGDVVVETNKGPQSVTHDLSSENIWGEAIRFFDLANGGVTKKACGSTGTGGMGSGGMSSSAGGASAGGPGSGGAPMGGTGNPGSGGMTSGAGMPGSSGTATGTGGTGTGTGGKATGAGGAATGSGGAATGTGGAATGTGGSATGTGGSTSGTAGKATGTGGKATGTGGTTGGPAGAGGDGTAGDSSGCGCRVAGESKGGGMSALLVAGLALLSTRRRRRERS